MNPKITLAAILLIASFAAAGCSSAKPGVQPAETVVSLAPTAPTQATSTEPTVSPSPSTSGAAAPPSVPSPTAASSSAAPALSAQPSSAPSVKPATAAPATPSKETTAPSSAPTSAAPSVPATSASSTPAASPKENAPSPSAALSAEVLYKDNCLACHAANLEGGYGPNLTKVGSRKTKEEIVQQITHGGKEMPPFEKQLSTEQIQALADWLAAKK